MKQVYIGVCNGLALLVDNSNLLATLRPMFTLNKNLFFVFVGAHSDAYGIETDHLMDGFGQTFVLDCCSDTEVLQFVVEEIYSVTCLLLTELSQRIGEGYVIVFTRYSFLCLCTDSQQQGKNESNISVHGG